MMRKHSTGSASIGFVVAAALVMGIGLASMRASFQFKNDRLIRMLNGMEGFYTSEMAAWSSYQEKNAADDGVGAGLSAVEDSRGFLTGLAEDLGGGQRTPNSVVKSGETEIVDESLKKTIRRGQKLKKTIELSGNGTSYCGSVNYSPMIGNYRTCLNSPGGSCASPILETCADTDVRIRGTANLYFSGMPSGSTVTYSPSFSNGDNTDRSAVAGFPDTSPARVMANKPCIANGNVITMDVGGRMSNGGGYGSDGAEGDTDDIVSFRNQDENGISDVVAPLKSLIGVFVGSTAPTLQPPPPRLDFSTPASRNYTEIQPLLQQVFFIGDGLRDDLSTHQKIVVPPGATALYLGTMDTGQWNNNDGEFTARLYWYNGDNLVCRAPDPSPTADLKVNDSNGPVDVMSGSSVTLTWSSANATACTLSDGATTNSVPLSNAGGQLATVSANTTFTLTCSKAGHPNALDSTQVTVFVDPPPTADLKINGVDGPVPVASGSSIVLTWSSSNATACTLNDGSTTTPVPTSNFTGQTVSNLTANRTFTLRCIKLGHPEATDNAQATVAACTATPAPILAVFVVDNSGSNASNSSTDCPGVSPTGSSPNNCLVDDTATFNLGHCRCQSNTARRQAVLRVYDEIVAGAAGPGSQVAMVSFPNSMNRTGIGIVNPFGNDKGWKSGYIKHHLTANFPPPSSGTLNNWVPATAVNRTRLDNHLSITEQPDGLTPYNGALQGAIDVLASAPNVPGAKKVIFFITDGIPSDDPYAANAKANSLKASGVTIYTIAYGKTKHESSSLGLSAELGCYYWHYYAAGKNVGGSAACDFDCTDFSKLGNSFSMANCYTQQVKDTINFISGRQRVELYASRSPTADTNTPICRFNGGPSGGGRSLCRFPGWTYSGDGLTSAERMASVVGGNRLSIEIADVTNGTALTDALKAQLYQATNACVPPPPVVDACDMTNALGLISFERLPDGSTPTAGMKIRDQYRVSHGITFCQDMNKNGQCDRDSSNNIIPAALVRTCSNEKHAFNSGSNYDCPNSGTGVFDTGRYFLVGSYDQPKGAGLIITYDRPVSQASGVLLDVDDDERWNIIARDINGNPLPGTASNPQRENIREGTIRIEDGDPGTGDGSVSHWSFKHDNADIYSIQFLTSGCENRDSDESSCRGFGFDNFSPSATCGTPQADLKVNGVDGPVTVTAGASVTLTWTSQNADSCTLTRGGTNIGSGTSNSTGIVATNVTDVTTFTLTCRKTGFTDVLDTAIVRIPSQGIFVSSRTYTGDLGGKVGADAKCQTLADSKSLGGKWVAVIAPTSGTTLATSATITRDVYDMRGNRIARQANFFTNTHENPIKYDESGADVGNQRVWTGMTQNSGSAITGFTCNNWADNTPPGHYGQSGATNIQWQAAGGASTNQSCGTAARLYCIEEAAPLTGCASKPYNNILLQFNDGHNANFDHLYACIKGGPLGYNPGTKEICFSAFNNYTIESNYSNTTCQNSLCYDAVSTPASDPYAFVTGCGDASSSPSKTIQTFVLGSDGFVFMKGKSTAGGSCRASSPMNQYANIIPNGCPPVALTVDYDACRNTSRVASGSNGNLNCPANYVGFATDDGDADGFLLCCPMPSGVLSSNAGDRNILRSGGSCQANEVQTGIKTDSGDELPLCTKLAPGYSTNPAGTAALTYVDTLSGSLERIIEPHINEDFCFCPNGKILTGNHTSQPGRCQDNCVTILDNN